MLQAAIDGLGLVIVWPNILYPVIGTLLAMVVSFLPGISGVTLMALALPLTFSWSPLEVVLLFGALVGGATFMGSVTAILFNVPGTAPSAATMLDGHPLAQQGAARMALGCAATASALGSTIGVGILIGLLPVVRPLLLSFGPLEFLLLCVWGLTTVAMVGGSPMRAWAMAGLGLTLAFIGRDPRTADPRFTFGADYLVDGLATVPVLLGLFAVAEIMRLVASGQRTLSSVTVDTGLGGSLAAGVLSVLTRPGLLLRSSVLGSLIGMVPGIGGTVASFVAYGHAVQSAEPPARFGEGDIRGVLAPEAAHDAKDGGSLLPTLAFGLPGSEGTVLLLAALSLHGLSPGRTMLDTQLPLVFALIWALFLSNWLTSLLGLAVAGPLARLMVIRTDLLAPIMLALAFLAAGSYRGDPLDIVLAALFGVAGYYLGKHGWPRVPLVIAFVLGAVLEDNLLLSLRLARLGRLDLLDRPIAWAMALLIAATIAWLWRAGSRPR
ncbi:MAG: tripartite tricarboxylate transporter permease [Geminicoccaceae bacterium]